MRIEPGEFRARPLRVHALLHDVPLEDAWAVPLTGGGAGRTIQDLRAVMVAGRAAAPAVVQVLFRLRGRIGALFGWDRRRPAWHAESYADRLTPADRAQSLTAPGTPDGTFGLLYRFDDEQLSELRNATVHAFVSLSIRPTPGGYLAYAGVFVRPVHRFTKLYMGAIAPFRRLVVYPAVIRKTQSAWIERYGGENIVESSVCRQCNGSQPEMSSTRTRYHIKAPRAEVYRALLDPHAVARWKVPDGMTCHVHAFEPREGGSLRISLTYDAPSEAGKTTAHTDTYHGRFVKLVPNEQIIEVDEFETDNPALRGEMTITITLADVKGGTEILAVHDGLPSDVSSADNETGWHMALAKLAALVETGSTTRSSGPRQ
jgi:uncharacterized protein YndB with AHSA1/START domain